MSNYKFVREYHKELPYTVKHIGGEKDLLAFRIQQQVKAERQAELAHYRREAKRERAMLKWLGVTAQPQTTVYTVKPSIFSITYNYLLNFFLDIKYNNTDRSNNESRSDRL